jgi:hypothetical protein
MNMTFRWPGDTGQLSTIVIFTASTVLMKDERVTNANSGQAVDCSRCICQTFRTTRQIMPRPSPWEVDCMPYDRAIQQPAVLPANVAGANRGRGAGSRGKPGAGGSKGT